MRDIWNFIKKTKIFQSICSRWGKSGGIENEKNTKMDVIPYHNRFNYW